MSQSPSQSQPSTRPRPRTRARLGDSSAKTKTGTRKLTDRTDRPNRVKTGDRYNTTKYSCGVVCVKRINDKPHVLLVRRRCSYAFEEFVLGRYKTDDDVQKLFDAMSVSEKDIVSGGDFEYMWKHMWGISTYKEPITTTAYQDWRTKSHKKFDAYWPEYTIVSDGISGSSTDNQYSSRYEKIRDMLTKSKTYGGAVWDVPKGKYANESEPKITCATREFSEETGIPVSDYVINPTMVQVYKNVANRVQYIAYYYFATASHDCEPKINYNSGFIEISDIAWVDSTKVSDYLPERQSAIIKAFIKTYRKKKLRYTSIHGPDTDIAPNAHHTLTSWKYTMNTVMTSMTTLSVDAKASTKTLPHVAKKQQEQQTTPQVQMQAQVQPSPPPGFPKQLSPQKDTIVKPSPASRKKATKFGAIGTKPKGWNAGTKSSNSFSALLNSSRE